MKTFLENNFDEIKVSGRPVTDGGGIDFESFKKTETCYMPGFPLATSDYIAYMSGCACQTAVINLIIRRPTLMILN